MVKENSTDKGEERLEIAALSFHAKLRIDPQI
ncbi:hypothetical protein AWB78_08534 [Caballeronia calidae]|uniref:Uncharacterized protein n=1 Tax=Caballeronia calidae TaxID=1777139 RepID=A0A158EKK5_9BURK|nr:hypothetical protein AWB78_08534 [Caballeronia calidae]